MSSRKVLGMAKTKVKCHTIKCKITRTLCAIIVAKLGTSRLTALSCVINNSIARSTTRLHSTRTLRTAAPAPAHGITPAGHIRVISQKTDFGVFALCVIDKWLKKYKK